MNMLQNLRLRSALSALLMSACLAAFAANPVDSFINLAGIATANVSLLVLDDATGGVVGQSRPHACTSPASTMKVLTTATALQHLGPDFAFTTYVETAGVIDSAGTLHGDLFVRGTGDPTLCSATFHTDKCLLVWRQKLQRLGIRRIEGSVIADMSAFVDDELNPQWLWEDIGSYYAPGIFALSYKDNTMVYELYAGADGSRVRVVGTSPRVDSLTIVNQMRCTSGMPATDPYVRGLPLHNERTLWGYVRPNRGRMLLKGDIPNPGLMLVGELTRLLRSGGISVEGEPGYTFEPAAEERQTLHAHHSPTLSEIVKQTNIHSNNMLAEHLFRYLGTLDGGNGTIDASAAFVRNFWADIVPDIRSAHIFDGSGLSTKDGISAQLLVDILRFMRHQSAYADQWTESLPVAGESGTLKTFLADTDLSGRVVAKSGTTSRIKGMAGYVDAPSGRRYVFAVLVHNAAIRSRMVSKEIETLLLNVCK